MPPELLHLLDALNSGMLTPLQRQEVEKKFVQGVFDWIVKSGASVLSKEAEIIQACQKAKLGAKHIQHIRNAFAILRKTLELATKAAKVPKESVWRAMMSGLRELFARMAGGAGKVGELLLRGGRLMTSGAAMLWDGIVAVAVASGNFLLRAVAGALEMIGGIEVLLGVVAAVVVILAAAWLLNWLYEHNREPLKTDDVLPRKLHDLTSQDLPRMPPIPAGAI